MLTRGPSSNVLRCLALPLNDTCCDNLSAVVSPSLSTCPGPKCSAVLNRAGNELCRWSPGLCGKNERLESFRRNMPEISARPIVHN